MQLAKNVTSISSHCGLLLVLGCNLTSALAAWAREASQMIGCLPKAARTALWAAMTSSGTWIWKDLESVSYTPTITLHILFMTLYFLVNICTTYIQIHTYIQIQLHTNTYQIHTNTYKYKYKQIQNTNTKQIQIHTKYIQIHTNTNTYKYIPIYIQIYYIFL